MNYFGPYTKKFQRLVECRVYIKHGEFEKAMHAFDDVDEGLSEKLRPYLSDISMASGLGHAMKIIVNIVYGMTSAPYDNKFKDPRNIDNCVAKRGALFMMTLELELEERGVAADDLIYYGLEYKFVTQYLTQQISHQEMFSQLEIAIHQFAKRQMTWFRGMERRGFTIQWISAEWPMEEKVGKILEML
jgi:hypothetical protein